MKKNFVIAVTIVAFVLGALYFFKTPHYTINCSYVTSVSEYDSRSIADTIQQEFGISYDNYTLLAAECPAATRAWEMKAKIKSQGSEYELYYRYGWCTPAGSDCGRIACFKSSDGSTLLYENVKLKLCNSIESYKNKSSDGINVIGNIYDNTTEVQNMCKTGLFEQTYGNQKIISIIDDSSRLGEFPSKGPTDCYSVDVLRAS